MTTAQKIFVSAIIGIMIIVTIGVSIYSPNTLEKPKGLSVVATFYPLYYFAQRIAGDKATVTMLIPDNVEPHTWEPAISDILSVYRANVFIYNGAGFEPWVNDVLSSVQTKNLTVVDTSKNIDLQLPSELEDTLKRATTYLHSGPFLIENASKTLADPPLIETTDICINLKLPITPTGNGGYLQLSIGKDGEYGFACTENVSFDLRNKSGNPVNNDLRLSEPLDFPEIKLYQSYELGPGMYTLNIHQSRNESMHLILLLSEKVPGGHQHGATDPHFWLDLLRAKIQVDNIAEGLNKADPSNADYYTQNAALLKARLDALNQAYQSGLLNRSKNDIITTHEGFDYLAKRYGFNAHAAIGISADAQPSTQDMARLVQLVKDLNLHYVFVEPIFSDIYMQTIAQETNAQILVLDGIHGRTGIHAHMDYFQIMEENLRNLRIGLEVK
jgi:ABC-type Zn uptake system ZnuABC Zn-binding protein ZnuA